MSKHSSCLLTVAMLALLLLSACARTRVKLPTLLQQAERHNVTGVAAESKQKFTAAEAEFIEAYRLFSSVENYSGMVVALINSSRLYRLLGDLEKSDNVLKQAVRLIAATPELEAEVCFEKSKLATLKGNVDSALPWAERAVNSASDRDRARMLNLAAVIHFRNGAVQNAGEFAEAALKSARSVADRREEANALRLLGEIAVMEKQYVASLQLYESALVIDKELAIPGRISADLVALSHAAEAQGDIPKGTEYLQRAVDAEIGDRNSKDAAGNLDRLIKLYEQTGNSQAAEKIRKLKKSLQAPFNPSP